MRAPSQPLTVVNHWARASEEFLPKREAVHLAHVVEIRPAEEGRGALEVQMIGDEHEATDVEGIVNRPGGIGEDDTLHPEFVHEADAGGDFSSGEAFVKMPAALGEEDGLSLMPPQNEASRMTWHGGGAQPRHVRI